MNADPRIRIPHVCHDSSEDMRSFREVISLAGLGISFNLPSNRRIFSSRSSIFSHRWEIRSVKTAMPDRLRGIVPIQPSR